MFVMQQKFNAHKKIRGEKGREVKIGPCLSKGGAARGASTPARRLSLQRHSGSLTSSGLAREPSDQSDNGGGKMKGLFKSKPRTPADIVRQTRDLLLYADRSKSLPDLRESKREEKMVELSRNIRDMKSILYGNSEAEPVAEACAQLTQEFFREDTLRLLITCLPKLNLETRKDATQLVANLQRQQVNSRLIASDYLEANLDLMDVLMEGAQSSSSYATETTTGEADQGCNRPPGVKASKGHGQKRVVECHGQAECHGSAMSCSRVVSFILGL
ncbi:hypothetical protein DY000_02030078 [Brassica cretica]|uniref:Uncharacterized protein n=1 Tax=Brassica cretica TaxID=69181 RepID=A0ABQ7DED6_BRACR|nr:hypothetical protein DY000_02030078 [Brassica cretica]